MLILGIYSCWVGNLDFDEEKGNLVVFDLLFFFVVKVIVIL